MTQQNNEERPKELGALWVKTSKTGKQYMSGVIEIEGVKQKIVCFANKKTNDTQPDYRILPSNDDWKNSQQNNQAGLNNEGQDEVRVEDIPF